jgi:serine/threonine protein kinase
LKVLVRHCLDLEQAGIFHGDIKPQNIILLRESKESLVYVARLIDFGGSILLEGGGDFEGRLMICTSGFVDRKVYLKFKEGGLFRKKDLDQITIYQLGKSIQSLLEQEQWE